MATKYSDRFVSATAGGPVNGRVARPIGGSQADVASMSTLGLALNDVNFFLAVPVGAELNLMQADTTDLDTGTNTLVVDLFLRTLDATGAIVDTVLATAWGPFTAAGIFTKLLNKVKVPESQLGFGLVGLKVTTAANVAGTTAVVMRGEWT